MSGIGVIKEIKATSDLVDEIHLSISSAKEATYYEVQYISFDDYQAKDDRYISIGKRFAADESKDKQEFIIKKSDVEPAKLSNLLFRVRPINKTLIGFWSNIVEGSVISEVQLHEPRINESVISFSWSYNGRISKLNPFTPLYTTGAISIYRSYNSSEFEKIYTDVDFKGSFEDLSVGSDKEYIYKIVQDVNANERILKDNIVLKSEKSLYPEIVSKIQASKDKADRITISWMPSSQEPSIEGATYRYSIIRNDGKIILNKEDDLNATTIDDLDVEEDISYTYNIISYYKYTKNNIDKYIAQKDISYKKEASGNVFSRPLNFNARKISEVVNNDKIDVDINLSWQKPLYTTDDFKYTLLVSNNGSEYELINDNININDTSYTYIRQLELLDRDNLQFKIVIKNDKEEKALLNNSVISINAFDYTFIKDVKVNEYSNNNAQITINSNDNPSNYNFVYQIEMREENQSTFKKVNTTDITFIQNQLDYTYLLENLEGAKTYIIRVKAYSEDQRVIQYSKEIQTKTLAIPEITYVDENEYEDKVNIKFSESQGATHYILNIDGVDQSPKLTTTSFTHTITEPTKTSYRYKIKAVYENQDYSTSTTYSNEKVGKILDLETLNFQSDKYRQEVVLRFNDLNVKDDSKIIGYRIRREVDNNELGSDIIIYKNRNEEVKNEYAYKKDSLGVFEVKDFIAYTELESKVYSGKDIKYTIDIIYNDATFSKINKSIISAFLTGPLNVNVSKAESTTVVVSWDEASPEIKALKGFNYVVYKKFDDGKYKEITRTKTARYEDLSVLSDEDTYYAISYSADQMPSKSEKNKLDMYPNAKGYPLLPVIHLRADQLPLVNNLYQNKIRYSWKAVRGATHYILKANNEKKVYALNELSYDNGYYSLEYAFPFDTNSEISLLSTSLVSIQSANSNSSTLLDTDAISSPFTINTSSIYRNFKDNDEVLNFALNNIESVLQKIKSLDTTNRVWAMLLWQERKFDSMINSVRYTYKDATQSWNSPGNFSVTSKPIFNNISLSSNDASFTGYSKTFNRLNSWTLTFSNMNRYLSSGSLIVNINNLAYPLSTGNLSINLNLLGAGSISYTGSELRAKNSLFMANMNKN